MIEFRFISGDKKSRTVYLLTLFWWFPLLCSPQSFPIGHQTITYHDPSRGNRPVPSELYYPATAAGENTPVAAGPFPVVVFGHGFQMGYDSYFYFRDALVPEGYILVFPKTETSLSPSHAEFGADLAYLVTRMKAEGVDPSSPFYQHVDSTAAIMGHSMGGGAAFLGCKNNTVPDAMVTWAAAETTPSAIAAARDIAMPALVFAAEKDCVTPPATNQVPMYDSLGSDCKVYVNITGGGHCYFADANFICSLGELGCPPFTISRDQQHATTLDFTRLYLARYLKNQPGAWTAFTDSLNSSIRITSQISCTLTSTLPRGRISPIRVFPNPARDRIILSGTRQPGGPESLTIRDVIGNELFSALITGTGNPYTIEINSSAWAGGVYIAEIRDKNGVRTARIIKK